MRESILVNVWVYTYKLDAFFKGNYDGHLSPTEPTYQTQLLVPYTELQIYDGDNTCRRV